jgi:hypothetical protein
MRYALIDDATLESAKRMEGIIPGNNTLEVAGDILALENLIQAILFCDEILYLDPNENKKSRHGKAFDLFRQVNLSKDVYAELLDITNKMTDNYLPCIEGGEFTDACFGAFFKDLDMEIRFVWEKSANAFCLTPRIIRSKRYTSGVLYRKLLSSILNELTDKNFLTDANPRPPLLYDSEGQIVNNCYQVRDKSGKCLPTRLSPQAEALFRAANYMAFRSNLHLIAARELGADLILSPMRNLFQWSCYHHFCLGNQGAIPSLSGMVSAGSDQKTDHGVMTGNGGRPAVIFHGIPKFAFWITEHMKYDHGFIKAAYELREEKEFAVLRGYLDELSEKAFTQNHADMPAIMAKLNGQFARIFKKYRVNPKKGLTSAVFSLTARMPAQAKLPGLESFRFRFDQDQTEIDAGSNNRQFFSVIYRPVRDDMLSLDEMTEYFDAITSKINTRPMRYCRISKLK